MTFKLETMFLPYTLYRGENIIPMPKQAVNALVRQGLPRMVAPDIVMLRPAPGGMVFHSNSPNAPADFRQTTSANILHFLPKKG